MTGKLITKEQIEALPKHMESCIGFMIREESGDYIKLSDLRALYDNAPSVGDSEIAGWQFYQDGKWWNGSDGKHKENTINAAIPVRNLYTIPQPDRVSELEAKLKEYEADAKRWRAICNLWLMCTELHLTQNEDGGYSIIPVEFVDNILMKNIDGSTPDEAIDQAMKG